MRGRHRVVWLVPGVLVTLGLVFALAVVGTVRQVRANHGDRGPVGSDDEAAFGWLAERVGAGERVLNFPYDGSGWMYPDAGLNPVFGMRLYAWDEPAFQPRWRLLRGVDRIGVDPEIARVAEALGVRYVYWGGDPWRRAPKDLTLEKLETARGLRLVFASGKVRIFEIVPR